ncbi:cobalt-precorrin 5A hydrolase [Desulfogranum japonicum]|uniref:cobalt-precorrin 5A hydrolase n=1 Tax=Desulfogranum japonicum TaxID=231447 RepID=UPI00040006C7|nr:cobalt-precorrin 5A hydrolase [Desulfogranum japonicum]
MKTAVLAITRGAGELGKVIAADLKADFYPCKGIMAATFSKVWQDYEAIICIMATGIVVRTMAPLLQDKRQDPAVVVCDELGKFAISLLSGHIGGANTLARTVAEITGGDPVITTASDVLGHTALDLWCAKRNLQIQDLKTLTRKMGRLVDKGSLHVYSELPLPALPEDLKQVNTPETADLYITCRNLESRNAAVLHPKALAVGLGCRRDTPQAVIAEAIATTCGENNLSVSAIAMLASVDLKQNEQGLLDYARENNIPLQFYTSDQLNQVDVQASSNKVLQVTGAKAVAEPAALLASQAENLLVQKTKFPAVTVAIAQIADPFK